MNRNIKKITCEASLLLAYTLNFAHLDVSIKGTDKSFEESRIIHLNGASGEISYLIFITSAICIAPRLRQRFEARWDGGDHHRYTARTVNAGCM